MRRLQKLLHAEVPAPIGRMRPDRAEARTPGMVGADGQRDLSRFAANITGGWDTNQDAHQGLRWENRRLTKTFIGRGKGDLDWIQQEPNCRFSS